MTTVYVPPDHVHVHRVRGSDCGTVPAHMLPDLNPNGEREGEARWAVFTGDHCIRCASDLDHAVRGTGYHVVLTGTSVALDRAVGHRVGEMAYNGLSSLLQALLVDDTDVTLDVVVHPPAGIAIPYRVNLGRAARVGAILAAAAPIHNGSVVLRDPA